MSQGELYSSLSDHRMYRIIEKSEASVNNEVIVSSLAVDSRSLEIKTRYRHTLLTKPVNQALRSLDLEVVH